MNVQRYRDINVQLAFDVVADNPTIYNDVYHYSGSSVRNVVYNNGVVPNEGDVHGWTWGSWDGRATYGFKLFTQAETLSGSGSVEFLLTNQNIPASGDAMRIKLYHLYQYGKSVTASTNYVRSSFVENGEPENTYWYKIEWDLTDEVSIRDDYDEGYAEGYQAALEACQNNE